LLRAARGVLGPHHAELEDVVQLGLLRTLRALPSFRGECRVMHFASRIGVRTAIDHARQLSAQRRAEEESLSRDAWSQPGTAGEPSHRILAQLLLDELTDVQAETLVMRAVFGCTISEIAETTGAPANTVRSRLRLAKLALKRRLDADPGMTAWIRGHDER
jgi:RNA polymerase sigma-70 factor (ECF subfamily)